MQHQQHQPRIVTTRKHYNTIDSSKSTDLTPTPTCELHRKGNQVRADVHDHSYRLRRVSNPNKRATRCGSTSAFNVTTSTAARQIRMQAATKTIRAASTAKQCQRQRNTKRGMQHDTTYLTVILSARGHLHQPARER